MPEQRSAQWYGGDDRNAYIHRAWMRRGLPAHAFDGRPHIAIANTASDLTPCNAHLDEVARSVEQGVYEAGGIPLNLPVVSLGETLVRPTAMLWRNLAAMAIEEMLRANPIDGVVLLGGCDKTIPALLMAAASVDLPAVVVPGGPMLTGTFRGSAARLRHRRVAAVGGDARGHAVAGAVPALGVVDDPQPRALQHDGDGVDDGPARRGARHGAAGPGGNPGAGQPVARGRARHRTARGRAGRRTAHARRSCSPAARSTTRSSPSPRSAARPTRSCTCSRSPVGSASSFTLDDIDRIGADVPLLVDLQPAGRHLMEDFFRAGGLHAVLGQVRDLLDPAARHGDRPAARRGARRDRRSGTAR